MSQLMLINPKKRSTRKPKRTAAQRAATRLRRAIANPHQARNRPPSSVTTRWQWSASFPS